MAKKVMVIGLSPEYNYDVHDHSKWSSNNTRYASNHGASLIARTLIDLFDADYVDNFENPERYKETYDLCVIAFATHITERRDVTEYADFIEKLGIKTVAFSLGIQDYSSSNVAVRNLHPSIIRLLKYVLSTSVYIGVRGAYTASLLIKSGIPSHRIKYIGCPTLFGPLQPNFNITKKDCFENPLVVYHRTMAELHLNVTDCPLLGQDFLDEVIFKQDIPDTNPIKQMELKNYAAMNNGPAVLKRIAAQGIFEDRFEPWLSTIGKHDFVLGARLHGCIAALIQGIPAVMLARDIRVEEIAKFYKIPYIRYEDIGDLTINEIYEQADYSEFNKLFPQRFHNFLCLMKKLEINTYMKRDFNFPDSFNYTAEDLQANTDILYSEINSIKNQLHTMEAVWNKKQEESSQQIKHIKRALKKLPGFALVKRLLK